MPRRSERIAHRYRVGTLTPDGGGPTLWPLWSARDEGHHLVVTDGRREFVIHLRPSDIEGLLKQKRFTLRDCLRHPAVPSDVVLGVARRGVAGRQWLRG